MRDQSPFLSLLQQALSEPIGVAVFCTSTAATDTLRQLLYVARGQARDAGEMEYDCLSLSIAPHTDDILYIYHRPSSNGRGVDPLAISIEDII